MFALGIAAAWCTLAEYTQLKLAMECGCRVGWSPDRDVDWYEHCSHHLEIQSLVRRYADEIRALL